MYTGGLSAGYIDCTQPLFAFLNFKRDVVALLKFVESNAIEVFGVEEKILRLAFARDESESTIRKSLYCSCHTSLICVFVEKPTPLLYLYRHP